jgi:hypothetical protein
MRTYLLWVERKLCTCIFRWLILKFEAFKNKKNKLEVVLNNTIALFSLFNMLILISRLYYIQLFYTCLIELVDAVLVGDNWFTLLQIFFIW